MGYKNLIFPPNSLFLVTGGAGFIGSNLCEAILNMGYRVRCLDNLSTGFQSNIDIFQNNPNFEFIHGDIRNFDVCMDACEEVDFVLHQAAWGSVPKSIEMPLMYEDINIKGTLNMLEASRQKKVKKFVYASSSSVYGDDSSLYKIEGREGNLLSPYAITKRVNEEYAKIYSKLYNIDTYGLRYFNVFGKRQNPDGLYAAVIPKFIKQLILNQRPSINGDGNQSRDFTYVENVIEANLRACFASRAYSGNVYNIACGSEENLNNLFGILCEMLDSKIQPVYVAQRAGDIMRSHADISKAKDELGYTPEYNLLHGIQLSIQWYKENM